jgi:glycerol uptake facilitator protein
MSPFTAELIGTALLILLGDGVVANVLLTRTKGHNAGWIVVTVGWALAVTLSIYCVGAVSGAHLNPAVTIGLASIGKFPWENVGPYVLAQMMGGLVGATLVWLAFLPHWRLTSDPGLKLGVFCTAPAVRHAPSNLITEIIGTFVLVFGTLAALGPENLSPEHGFKTALGPLLVGAIVLSIGVSLGGPTGYAINPARDFAPRLAHAILPIAGKGNSDWGYAWVPIIGPIAGGVLAAYFYRALWPV